MKFKIYLIDRLHELILEICVLGIILFFLIIYNMPTQDIAVIGVIYVIAFIVKYMVTYTKRNSYLSELHKRWNELDEKHLICEFIEKPGISEYELFYELIRDSGYSLNQEIARSQSERDEYREYIERLVHEIKLPISVIKLIGEKEDHPDYYSVKEEIEKIQGYVEQVLYYARSQNVENDYFIKEVNLTQTIKNVIKKHRNQLIAKNIAITLPNDNIIVLSDDKWIEFIISQLLDNAIKYSDSVLPEIRFSIEHCDGSVKLSILNNGQVIPKEDRDRIFDKGFTGQNGRQNQYSTGMGLYITKQLLERLGHKAVYSLLDKSNCFSIFFN